MAQRHRARSGALGPAVLGVGLLLATASDAWAYIDPGTGSYLFQIAAAGLLTAIYTMRSYLRGLTSLLRGRPRDVDASPSATPRANGMD